MKSAKKTKISWWQTDCVKCKRIRALIIWAILSCIIYLWFLG
ncbi:hypothetical protein GARC_2127 [Paraglaciecola arctica BSs20135]|uniref:Uncharacterized protein n=1 Tax=Paraglaciecola arctica BSs20135 TaxID=493475 RepID=K6XEM5_9ALTE|nr:hypothetical protein GARC_2127 [Paraglaciecola arctica BSs20135]